MQLSLKEIDVRRVLPWLHGLFFDKSKEAKLSIGICRIFLAISLLWTLDKHAIHFASYGSIIDFAGAFSSNNYTPFGILKIFGMDVPDPNFLSITMKVAWVSSFLAMIGMFSRPSMIVAVISTLIITTFRESFGLYWSHGYLVVMVAGLGFMLGQSGASLSLDSLLAKRFKHYPFRSKTSLGYWWPVALGQAAIVLFYFGAGIAKHLDAGILNWIISDNLRNSLAVTWFGYDPQVVPWYIELIMNNYWLWVVAAAGHMFTQFFPVLAIIHKNNPLWRLAEGVVYVGGIFLLYFAMTVWNPVWIPLGAFFIDWEWALGKLGVSKSRLAHYETEDINPSETSWAIFGYAYAFLGFYIATFSFQWSYKHLMYPFSDLDFYSSVRAKAPYSEHLPYDFLRGHIVVKLEKCDLDPKDFDNAGLSFNSALVKTVKKHCDNDGWFRYPNFTSTYPEFYRAEGHSAVKSGLETTHKYLTSKNSTSYALPGIEKVRIERAIWVYPAYPLNVNPVVTHAGVRGVLDVETGIVKSMSARYFRGLESDDNQLYIEIKIEGYDSPVIEAFYRSDPDYSNTLQDLKPLNGSWVKPNLFAVDMNDKLIADVDGRPYDVFRVTEESDPEESYEFWGAGNMTYEVRTQYGEEL